MRLSTVHFILTLELNTLSCSKLDDRGITTVILKIFCRLIDREQESSSLENFPQKKSDGSQAVDRIHPNKSGECNNFPFVY